jgi:hypothetical protein
MLYAVDSTPRALRLWLNIFVDVGDADVEERDSHTLADAGVGLALRGMLYDQPLRIRLDFPLLLSRRDVEFGDGRRWRASDGVRWTLSFNDLW